MKRRSNGSGRCRENNGKTNPDNLRAARSAGLTYVSEERIGISRKPHAGGFVYFSAKGKCVHDQRTIRRIEHLAIPPAYRDVWICPDPNGHIQAVGRDDRGRKQYRYHEAWRAVRDEAKYGRLTQFGKVLPEIRAAVNRHLRLKGLPKSKVLAAIVRLMELTLMRIGNDEYAKANHSYGLTTLQDRHARISRAQIHLEYRGKSGIHHIFDINDRRLARIARRCQDLPGQELFQYLDEKGNVCDIGSGDVNEYLREIAGRDITAKDFRTWAGTVLAMTELVKMGPAASEAQAKRNIVQAIAAVSKKLGNTRAVCRRCYIHPQVLAAYLENDLDRAVPSKRAGRLRGEERAVLKLLRRREKRHAKRP